MPVQRDEHAPNVCCPHFGNCKSGSGFEESSIGSSVSAEQKLDAQRGGKHALKHAKDSHF